MFLSFSLNATGNNYFLNGVFEKVSVDFPQFVKSGIPKRFVICVSNMSQTTEEEASRNLIMMK